MKDMMLFGLLWDESKSVKLKALFTFCLLFLK